MARQHQPDTLRMAPQFAVIRYALIHILANKDVPTTEIASKLKANRSYVIRLQRLDMKPVSEQEKAVMKLAAAHETALRNLGMGFAFKGGIETQLAGGDRSHLPPDQRGGRPRKGEVAPKAAKPKAPAKAKAKPAKAAPKPKATKPAVAKGKAPPKPKVQAAVKAKPAAKPKTPKPAKAKTPKVEPQVEAPQADLLTSLPEAA